MILAYLAALTATPATLPAQIKAAQAGDSITLTAGAYGAITITNRTFAAPVLVDASAAELTALTIRKVDGLEWRGGTLAGPREASIGVNVVQSAHVTIKGMVISGPKAGIAFSEATDFEAVGNRFDGVRSDGVLIAMSQRGRIIGNQCLNFRPIRATYDAKGKLIKDGDHPDCIQGWSRLAYPPTGDLLIEGNVAHGEMQGITFFDAGQGGYDRITIRNNDLMLEYWHGVAVYEGRGTVITGNRVRTIPSAKARNFPFQPIKAWVYTLRGVGQRVCGNEVPAMPGGEGTGACK
jgi:nitrous oxidase accessory protein NosD